MTSAEQMGYNVGMAAYVVSLDWDEEASRWYAINDEIPIMLEDDSLDALIRRTRLAAPELLEMNGADVATASLLFKMEPQAVAV